MTGDTGRNIVLIGFMATGKTTVGRELARRLGRPFVDTDEEVAARAGMSIPEIFARHGEAAFRDLEAQVVAEVAGRTGQVIAAGGGALLREENRDRLRATGVLVRLLADPEAIVARVLAEGARVRPLLAGGDGDLSERVRALLAAREGVYQGADVTVDTTHLSVDQVVEEILHHLEPARTVRVALGERAYDVVIGEGVLGGLGQRLAEALGGPAPGRRALVVTHPLLNELYGDEVRASLEAAGFAASVAEVPPGEETKSLAQAAELYDRCLDAGLDRLSPVVALGGGVVGDLAGFVAATFLRGVPFAQVPTTLLAQVDASVGGKVGVNHPRAKNVIGAFHQPRLVLADVRTLRTLPEREFVSGLAEVVKHGVIADPAYFARVEGERKALLERRGDALIRAVAGSVRIKAAVVEADERESWRRMVLNFGHTVGHGIEAAGSYRGILHGEAVAVGMVAAGRLALEPEVRAGLGGEGPVWTEEAQGRLEGLLASLGLPVRVPGLPADRVLAAMALDKKSRAGQVHWVLPRAIGRVEIVGDVPAEAVRRVLVALGASE